MTTSQHPCSLQICSPERCLVILSRRRSTPETQRSPLQSALLSVCFCCVAGLTLALYFSFAGCDSKENLAKTKKILSSWIKFIIYDQLK